MSSSPHLSLETESPLFSQTGDGCGESLQELLQRLSSSSQQSPVISSESHEQLLPLILGPESFMLTGQTNRSHLPSLSSPMDRASHLSAKDDKEEYQTQGPQHSSLNILFHHSSLPRTSGILLSDPIEDPISNLSTKSQEDSSSMKETASAWPVVTDQVHFMTGPSARSQTSLLREDPIENDSGSSRLQPPASTGHPLVSELDDVIEGDDEPEPSTRFGMGGMQSRKTLSDFQAFVQTFQTHPGNTLQQDGQQNWDQLLAHLEKKEGEINEEGFLEILRSRWEEMDSLSSSSSLPLLAHECLDDEQHNLWQKRITVFRQSLQVLITAEQGHIRWTSEMANISEFCEQRCLRRIVQQGEHHWHEPVQKGGRLRQILNHEAEELARWILVKGCAPAFSIRILQVKHLSISRVTVVEGIVLPFEQKETSATNSCMVFKGQTLRVGSTILLVCSNAHHDWYTSTKEFSISSDGNQLTCSVPRAIYQCYPNQIIRYDYEQLRHVFANAFEASDPLLLVMGPFVMPKHVFTNVLSNISQHNLSVTQQQQFGGSSTQDLYGISPFRYPTDSTLQHVHSQLFGRVQQTTPSPRSMGFHQTDESLDGSSEKRPRTSSRTQLDKESGEISDDFSAFRVHRRLSFQPATTAEEEDDNDQKVTEMIQKYWMVDPKALVQLLEKWSEEPDVIQVEEDLDDVTSVDSES